MFVYLLILAKYFTGTGLSIIVVITFAQQAAGLLQPIQVLVLVTRNHWKTLCNIIYEINCPLTQLSL